MSEIPPSPFAPPRTENFDVTEAAVGEVPHGAIEALRKTRPWVIFLAILTFLAAGLMVLAGIMVAVMGAIPGAAEEQPFGRLGWALGLIYLVLGAAYIYPGVRLLQYGLAIGRLVQGRRPADLEQALDLQMRFWRFFGIMTVALIALYFLVIVVLVGAAATGALKS